MEVCIYFGITIFVLMIYIFYNVLVVLVGWLLIPVSWFNKKINLFLQGRKNTFQKIAAIKTTDKVAWFHCASLGEFEQGKPIIEKLKIQIPTIKIVVTFFSPSGYEVSKDYKTADVICYLPLDTKKNVKRFLDKLQPEIAIFIKYEFWPNLLQELRKRNTHTLLVSGIFRKNQVFFKKNMFIDFMQKQLKTFNHFFIQDINSKELLHSINFKNVTVCGDTRFDRVFEITKQNNTLPFVEKFVKNKRILVAGSTWKKDEELLINYINNYATDEEKFIIAPHNITDIEWLKNAFTKDVTLYSEQNKNTEAQVFIVDTIGILTKVYSYGDIAYVGGGFGTGIHNVLEPATFGLPIIIGPKYQKFKEAIDLVAEKGCFVINNTLELKTLLMQFRTDKVFEEKARIKTKNYIISNLGATDCIISYITKNNSTLQH